jgi:hypothetical protein
MPFLFLGERRLRVRQLILQPRQFLLGPLQLG